MIGKKESEFSFTAFDIRSLIDIRKSKYIASNELKELKMIKKVSGLRIKKICADIRERKS